MPMAKSMIVSPTGVTPRHGRRQQSGWSRRWKASGRIGRDRQHIARNGPGDGAVGVQPTKPAPPFVSATPWRIVIDVTMETPWWRSPRSPAPIGVSGLRAPPPPQRPPCVRDAVERHDIAVAKPATTKRPAPCPADRSKPDAYPNTQPPKENDVRLGFYSGTAARRETDPGMSGP